MLKSQTSLAYQEGLSYLYPSMATKSSREESKGVRKPKTEQRTYRFNSQLWEDFERNCARHLRNPRLVVEALVRHWLDTDDKGRSAIAQHYEEHSDGASSGD
jgi:hypothetical protein